MGKQPKALQQNHLEEGGVNTSLRPNGEIAEKVLL